MHLILLPFLRQEHVHAHQWQRTVVFLAFVIETLFLNFSALIHRIHGAQYTAAFGNALKFLVYRLFDQVSQFVDNE